MNEQIVAGDQRVKLWLFWEPKSCWIPMSMPNGGLATYIITSIFVLAEKRKEPFYTLFGTIKSQKRTLGRTSWGDLQQLDEGTFSLFERNQSNLEWNTALYIKVWWDFGFKTVQLHQLVLYAVSAIEPITHRMTGTTCLARVEEGGGIREIFPSDLRVSTGTRIRDKQIN